MFPKMSLEQWTISEYSAIVIKKMTGLKRTLAAFF